MSKISPVNGHLLIEPIAHEEFIATQHGTYEEIGVVIEVDANYAAYVTTVKPGDKVYFDSWLCAKFPKPDGNSDEFWWLVQWEDVRAVERLNPPEQYVLE